MKKLQNLLAMTVALLVMMAAEGRAQSAFDDLGGVINGSEVLTESMQNAFVAAPGPTPTPTPANVFGRLSTRARVSTGQQILISSFVVTGGATKKVLMRALGPSLAGVSGQLANPTLELRDVNGALVSSNDNWMDNPAQAAAILATGQAPSNNFESALIATVPPGNYVALVQGVNNTTGVGKADIIDIGTLASSQLGRISSQAFTSTADNIIVGEFTINGPQSQRLIIRGLGPSLAAIGVLNVLGNPTLELRNSSGALLITNNDWQDDSSQAALITSSGLAPTNILESAIATTLPPGSYTADLAGLNCTTGVAAVEVYNLGLAGNTVEIPVFSGPLQGCGLSLPGITSPPNATGGVGRKFTYQFTATNAALLEIPGSIAPGLTFNPSLGLITGIPTTAGVFPVGLRASNSAGTTLGTLTITVQATPLSGPVIISSTAATGRAGRAFSFRLQTIGGSSATRFAVENVLPPGFNLDPSTGFISGTPASAGNFSLAVAAIDGTAITRGTLQLTFTSDPNFPIITSPATAILAPGQLFTYSITADASGIFGYIGSDGIVHQAPSPSCAGLPAGLCFDGNHTISGTFNPTFGSDRESPTRPDQTGGIITNVQLFVANLANGTGILEEIFFRIPTAVANISTRLTVGTGEDVLIGGFIIAGNAPKKVIIRAIGPSLTQVGVPNALQDSTLELRDAAGLLLSANDNWRDNPGQATQIIETQLQPSDDREAAIVAYLNPDASYTALVRGKNNSTGTALVEVYDGGAVSNNTSNSRLANIATRGTVLGGDSVMIGGFIIRETATRLVVRAIGPSLTAFGISGALPDPTLELKNSNGVPLIGNDDWQTNPTQATEIQQRMLAPGNPRESALITTLPAGQYTAIVSGKGGATGVALVEAYVLE